MTLYIISATAIIVIVLFVILFFTMKEVSKEVARIQDVNSDSWIVDTAQHLLATFRFEGWLFHVIMYNNHIWIVTEDHEGKRKVIRMIRNEKRG